jgi:hypothetical protein
MTSIGNGSPLDGDPWRGQNPPVTKPDPDSPRIEAEILPFRAPAKPEPSKPVRAAPAAVDEDTVEPLSTSALVKIGLFVLFLVVSGVWLMNTLREIGIKEDCAMQGRRNCVTIAVPGRNP